MATSFRLHYNPQRVSPEGIATLYLRVIIHRRKKEINLKLRWPVEFIDLKEEKLLPRMSKDPDVRDYNMIIRTEMSKVNEVFKHFRLADQVITIERFMESYRSELSSADFVAYFKQKIINRRRTREIKDKTYDNHMRMYRKLYKFTPVLPFNEITDDWPMKFENWLKRDVQARNKDAGTGNTRSAHHKVIKAYMNIAAREHIRFVNPYERGKFKVKKFDGNWYPLDEDEISRLYDYYHSPAITLPHKRVTRAFLFACFAGGPRRADLFRLEPDWIDDGVLRFIPQKTQDNVSTMVVIHLNKIATEMYHDALEERPRGRIFNYYSDQYFNRKLQEVQQICGITTRMHIHTSRHTFGTVFMDKTKDAVATQHMMGHASLNSTEKYIHMNKKKARERINMMDDIIESRKEGD